ncbi:MAG: hypothetical protein IJF54_04485 [Clostridia bacterium]|nr:hypothetical protein [Clostridia bacterium]
MFNRLKQFMYGRYGSDQLSMALIILAFVISFITILIGIPFLNLISYIPLGFVIFRTFSRNISKRYAENQKFLKYYYPIQTKIKTKITRAKDKNNKYYKCKGCGATLRVPKGKGRIDITCPKCRTKFTKRT